MIKVAVVGGTGYTGVELLRLLASHPEVSLQVITSRSEAGIRVSDMFPNLRGHVDIKFSVPDISILGQCDLVFFATPNGVAMKMVPELLSLGVKVIDLAADFRLKSPDLWEKWYGQPHACPELLEKSVYGLPEMHRKEIKGSVLVANPGCYPTSVQLGYAPLLKNDLIDSSTLIADCKSGVSGAGRKESVAFLQAESSESVKAYAVEGHRHNPEITQGLQELTNNEVNLVFVPHLMPMIRGIHSTLYATLHKTDKDLQSLQALYEEYYENEPFVDVLPVGSHPETRSVKGSNMCRIAIARPNNGNTVIILSVIDNLLKGAAGQAIQNMNIMFGLRESQGLESIAILP